MVLVSDMASGLRITIRHATRTGSRNWPKEEVLRGSTIRIKSGPIAWEGRADKTDWSKTEEVRHVWICGRPRSFWW